MFIGEFESQRRSHRVRKRLAEPETAGSAEYVKPIFHPLRTTTTGRRELAGRRRKPQSASTIRENERASTKVGVKRSLKRSAEPPPAGPRPRAGLHRESDWRRTFDKWSPRRRPVGSQAGGIVAQVARNPHASGSAVAFLLPSSSTIVGSPTAPTSCSGWSCRTASSSVRRSSCPRTPTAPSHARCAVP